MCIMFFVVEAISCGGNFSGVDGEITSQNYPENYNNDETCEWLLIVNDTQTLQIDISHMDIENSTSCVNDYLQVITTRLLALDSRSS